MAQDIVLALDDYERRYLTTVDPIETVLGDAYLNKFKRELEIDEILTVRIGSERHRIRIIQTDPFVATVREYDSYFDNRISALETDTPPPDPDPTDPATWNATIDDNKLIADNVVFNYTQLANRGWIIVVDSATVPTNDAVLGVSPPTGFTPGDWPRTNTASSYSAGEDWYFYEYDDVAGIVLVSSTVGDDFVTVTPNDTLGPTGLSISAVDAVVTLVAATDAGIGLATNPYTVFVDNVPYIENIGPTELTHTINKPAGQYAVYYLAVDASGNGTESDPILVTVAAATVGSVGWTNVSNSFSESVTPQDITLTRAGTGAFDIDVSTIEWTAEAGVNYTAKTNETVSFGSGDTVKSLAGGGLTVADTSATDIKQAFLVIDYESGTNNILVSGESTELLFQGSGVTEDAGFQMDSVSPYALTVEAEAFTDSRNSIASGQTGDAWSISNDYGSRWVDSLGASTWTSANDYGSSSALDIESCWVEYDLAIDSAAVGANGATDLFDLWFRVVRSSGATYCHGSIVRNVASITEAAGTATVTLTKNHGGFAGTETIYFEGVTGTNAAEYNAVAGLTPGAIAAGNTTFTIAGVGSGSPGAQTTASLLGADPELIGMLSPAFVTVAKNNEWENTNLATNQVDFYCDAAGTEKLRFYCRDNDWRFDRFSIAPRASGWTITDVDVDDAGVKGNSQDDEMGLIASEFSTGSSGTPGANPDNLPNLWKPLPASTVNPTSVSPDYGVSNVGLTSTVLIKTDLSQLEVNYCQMLEPSGQVRANTSYSVNGSDIILDPGTSLSAGSTYTVQLSARGIDSSGDMQSVVFSTIPYVFTAQSTGAALWSADLSEFPAVPVGGSALMPINEAITVFESPYLNGSNSANSFSNGHMVLRNDADVFNQLRGNIMEIKFFDGQAGTSTIFDIGRDTSPGWAEDELWIGLDIGLQPGWVCPPSIHMTKFTNWDFTGTDTGGQMGAFIQLWGNNPSNDSPAAGRMGPVDNCLAVYFYDAVSTRRTYYARFDQPNYNSVGSAAPGSSAYWIQGAQYAALQPGVLHRVVMQCKANTTGTTSADSDGILKLWLDGNLVVSKTNMPWRNMDTHSGLQWDRLTKEDHVGGSRTLPWASTQDQSYFYDRFILSTTAIT